MPKKKCCQLFDWNLDEYLTPALLGLIYKIAVLLAVLWGLCTFLGGLFGHTHWFWKIFVFVWAPVGTLLWILIARLSLETVKAIFEGAGIKGSCSCCGGGNANGSADTQEEGYVAPKRFGPYSEL